MENSNLKSQTPNLGVEKTKETAAGEKAAYKSGETAFFDPGWPINIFFRSFRNKL